MTKTVATRRSLRNSRAGKSQKKGKNVVKKSSRKKQKSGNSKKQQQPSLQKPDQQQHNQCLQQHKQQPLRQNKLKRSNRQKKQESKQQRKLAKIIKTEATTSINENSLINTAVTTESAVMNTTTMATTMIATNTVTTNSTLATDAIINTATTTTEAITRTIINPLKAVKMEVIETEFMETEAPVRTEAIAMTKAATITSSNEAEASMVMSKTETSTEVTNATLYYSQALQLCELKTKIYQLEQQYQDHAYNVMIQKLKNRIKKLTYDLNIARNQINVQNFEIKFLREDLIRKDEMLLNRTNRKPHWRNQY